MYSASPGPKDRQGASERSTCAGVAKLIANK
jgi:hypothetical protein